MFLFTFFVVLFLFLGGGEGDVGFVSDFFLMLMLDRILVIFCIRGGNFLFVYLFVRN